MSGTQLSAPYQCTRISEEQDAEDEAAEGVTIACIDTQRASAVRQLEQGLAAGGAAPVPRLDSAQQICSGSECSDAQGDQGMCGGKVQPATCAGGFGSADQSPLMASTRPYSAAPHALSAEPALCAPSRHANLSAPSAEGHQGDGRCDAAAVAFITTVGLPAAPHSLDKPASPPVAQNHPSADANGTADGDSAAGTPVDAAPAAAASTNSAHAIAAPMALASDSDTSPPVSGGALVPDELLFRIERALSGGLLRPQQASQLLSSLGCDLERLLEEELGHGATSHCSSGDEAGDCAGGHGCDGDHRQSVVVRSMSTH